MYGADIQIKDNQKLFYVGDTVSGTALVTLPKDVPLSNVSLSFHCRGEVKWIEVVDMLHYLQSHTYYEKKDYLEEEFDINNADTMTRVTISHDDAPKKITIPFSFAIPKDSELPSTMISSDGFVKYFIRLTFKLKDEDEAKKFYKEVVVLSPFDKNLMVTVGATAEKSVLLHSGTVSMHASIGRKGFAPGETITVHVAVDNQTNTKVVPQISLNQTQIYSSGIRLKVLENTLNEESVSGTEIAPHTKVEELLSVTVPENESMSIKSSLITVKYFINVTLDIPHSFNLHVNLPLVVTSKSVIEQLQDRKNDQPEMIAN